MFTIVVNSAACRYSGALTIYIQFISHLKDNVRGDIYYVFIDSSMPQPEIQGVTYIYDDNHSWSHRIYWDYVGCRRYLKKHNIVPDVIVSLQNSGIITDCRQVIYYHQSIPFYKKRWDILKPEERIMALYKHAYPYIITPTFNKHTEVVVQIPFIKKGFIKRFHLKEDNIHVFFPDIEDIDVDTIQPVVLDSDKYHLLYPAVYVPYKEHRTIVEAMALLKMRNKTIADNVRIHFTLSLQDAPALWKLIRKKDVEANFVFEGKMPHDILLSFYKSVGGLIFPSIIETLGLPLIEAAKFGLPVIAANLDYAREVLEEYEGVTYVEPYGYDTWADFIEKACLSHDKYKPMKSKQSSWPDFFALIHNV